MRVSRRLWALAALFVLYAATIPFQFVSELTDVQSNLAAATARSALAAHVGLSKADILQNILLFIPIGFLGVPAVGRVNRIVAAGVAVAAAAGLSAACELLQLLTVDRLTSVWDVAANAAGAAVGAGLWITLAPIGARAWASLPASPAERDRVFPLVCAVAVACVAGWEPFDITLDVGTVWSKVKPWIDGSAPGLRPISDELLTALRFAIVAGLGASGGIGDIEDHTEARRHGGILPVGVWARRALTILLGCALLAFGLEATQFLITSRTPSLQDPMCAIAGTLVGIAFAPVAARARPVPALVAVLTAAAAIPFYLQPFVLAPAYRSVSWLPFRAYYEFTSMQTVSHVLELMLIYGPIGFAFAWRDAGSVQRGLLVTAVVACALEWSQGWIVGRYPDLTDLGVALLGAYAGAYLARAGRMATP